MDSILKLCALTKYIGHERTCGTVRNMGYGFWGRSWGDHLKRMRRTEPRYEIRKRIERKDCGRRQVWRRETEILT